MHLGVILPNYGEEAAPDRIRRMAEAAEELGFDSVWATEHIIVGPEAVDPFGRVFAPLVTLAWVAGFTERIGLGTSIVLVPLHHPIHLAKEVATLQELSRSRVRLGVGTGWHEDEFRFLGCEFRGRGRRADEALRLMRALWDGERAFHGEHWSFEDATFAPLPEPQPGLWVGGSSERAIRRARELGDVWHPSRGASPDGVRRAKERYPDCVSSRARPPSGSSPSLRRAPRARSSASRTRQRCAVSPDATAERQGVGRRAVMALHNRVSQNRGPFHRPSCTTRLTNSRDVSLGERDLAPRSRTSERVECANPVTLLVGIRG